MGSPAAGYGSILTDGPWKGSRTLSEFYVAPQYRCRLFDLFDCLLTASNATAMKAQTNDAVLTVMLHAWAQNVSSEKIIFEDKLTTARLFEGMILRQREAEGCRMRMVWRQQPEASCTTTSVWRYLYGSR